MAKAFELSDDPALSTHPARPKLEKFLKTSQIRELLGRGG
jgi:hypothetical protein